jgi:hypothetical protein
LNNLTALCAGRPQYKRVLREPKRPVARQLTELVREPADARLSPQPLNNLTHWVTGDNSMRRTLALFALLAVTVFWAGCASDNANNGNATNTTNMTNTTSTPVSTPTPTMNTNTGGGNTNMSGNMSGGNANRTSNTTNTARPSNTNSGSNRNM